MSTDKKSPAASVPTSTELEALRRRAIARVLGDIASAPAGCNLSALAGAYAALAVKPLSTRAS